MGELTLRDILEEMCLEEANEFANMENIPHQHFSLRHRRRMRKILSTNRPGRRSLRNLPPSKRVAAVVLIILLATFTFAAGAIAISGFIRKDHRDNTQLFPADIGNCPVRIEHEYYLSEIPEGYELYEKNINPFVVYIKYINPTNQDTLIFVQNVKEGYEQHFDNEKAIFEEEEIDINDYYGLYLNLGNKDREKGVIVWDNGDYIMEVKGFLSKNELINLAKSAKL